MLDTMIRVGMVLAPQPDAVFPPWQGMQYLRDMFTGDARLTPRDNARYPAPRWTSVRALFASREQESEAAATASHSRG